MQMQVVRKSGVVTLLVLLMLAVISQPFLTGDAAAEGNLPDPPYGDPIVPDSTEGDSSSTTTVDSSQSLLGALTDFIVNMF